MEIDKLDKVDDGYFWPIYEIKLSILVATIPSRKQQFDDLMKCLHSQIYTQLTDDVFSSKPVQVVCDMATDYNIGVKRNKLLDMAHGSYVVFIDDDDLISPNYIANILKATETNPDCIGINGTVTFNGTNERKWYISKEYGHWHERGSVYYRTPNHISPVRRELALQAGFPEVSFAEDFEYSRRLLPLLKTECLISEPMYIYRYVKDK